MELNKYLKEQDIVPDFDNFSDTNEKVFYREEKCYEENNTYFLLSMMSCILLDLGILRE